MSYRTIGAFGTGLNKILEHTQFSIRNEELRKTMISIDLTRVERFTDRQIHHGGQERGG